MISMDSIRAICFDLDNTLWDVLPVLQRAQQSMHTFVGERYPQMLKSFTPEAASGMREQMSERYPHMAHDYSFLRRQSLIEHVRLANLPDDVAEEIFEVFIRARSELEPFPDVVPALERLKRSHRLISMSNGNANLAAIGLDRFFEFHIAASDAGALKPDARIYRKMLERARLQPHEVLHVGDDPVADIEGARKIGMPSIWINRQGQRWPEQLEPPTHHISNLAEMAEFFGAQLKGGVEALP
jgi:2-haloalkanoic acid dehalogenase type II